MTDTDNSEPMQEPPVGMLMYLPIVFCITCGRTFSEYIVQRNGFQRCPECSVNGGGEVGISQLINNLEKWVSDTEQNFTLRADDVQKYVLPALRGLTGKRKRKKKKGEPTAPVTAYKPPRPIGFSKPNKEPVIPIPVVPLLD